MASVINVDDLTLPVALPFSCSDEMLLRALVPSKNEIEAKLIERLLDS